MPSLPASIIFLLQPFAALFAAPTWRKAQVLLVGAILAPGKRTVSSALQVLGLHEQRDFARYHHVLSRAVWSSLAVSRALLGLLVCHLAPATGPLCLGIDETIERRKGPRIAAKGVYRDGVRSSQGHFVKAMGLRWISLMWLVELPWARRVWALPFLTVLAPSTRYHAARHRRHKTVTDWARQMLCCVRRWLPARDLVVVGDRGYAALRLLAACQRMTPAVTFLTRLRLDAALYAPPPPRAPGQMGRPRLKGARLPSLHTVLANPATVWTPLRQQWPDGTMRRLEYVSDTAVWYHAGQPPVPIRWLLIRDPAQRQQPQALLSTDPTLAPPLLLTWYLRRWSMEVTFQAVRTYLGVETPPRGYPQWSHQAILRTTPALLGLFSWLALATHVLQRGQPVVPRRSAWYAKQDPTFSDVLAFMRQTLWRRIPLFHRSPFPTDSQKLAQRPPPTIMEVLCYTA